MSGLSWTLLRVSLIGFEHIDKFIEAIFLALINGDSRFLNRYHILMHSLVLREKKICLYSLLRVLSRRHLSSSLDNDTNKKALENEPLNGVAALVAGFMQGNSQLEDALLDWLAGTSADSVSQSHDTHRAVIAALSGDRGAYSAILCKVLMLI